MGRVSLLEIVATVTERGQTTIPAAIRKTLALRKHDHIVFRQMSDGSVIVEKQGADADDEDAVLSRFLEFLAQDMTARPETICPVGSHFLDDHQDLRDVAVDLNSRLGDDEE